MRQIQSPFEYQVGGSLDRDAPSYVMREADWVFYEALKTGEFCYVLNSRQMGKSSLRVRTMQRLQAEGIICIFIDLTGMGKQDMTPEQWYAGIVQSLVSNCDLNSKIQWRTWWRERRDLLSPVQRLSLFIEEVLLVEIKQNIVIFVDEIDRILSQNFSLDDFLSLIRFFWQQRGVNPEYNRLTFALLGVATPHNLMRDKTQTPFNIGKAIALSGFSLQEVQPLIEGLQGKVNHPEAVIKEILDWTGGQPFLTQKLCQMIVSELVANKFTSVEEVVKSRILDNWESQDEPEHLRTIRDRICYRNEQRTVRLLGLYEKILDQGYIAADGTSEQVELRLSGLVVEREGKIKVYNRLYGTVFDPKWLHNKLSNLRPYGEAMNIWIASGGEDQLALLHGTSLQDALAWALGKSLSDLDYQFLGASQELAKHQAQIALEEVEQANQLLATARQKATQELLRLRISWVWMPLIALGVTAPILLMSWLGLWQGLEWNVLDQFFRWRPLEPPDKKIVIVTIDESDITEVGKWPLPDKILAQAIANLKVQKPSAIGLDIYRDLPVEPGHRDLVKLFQSTPNLFGIEKVIEPRIASPPTLSQLQQVGFADQIVDADGKIRRALLSVSLSDQEVHYSLAVRLALHYLETKGITLKTSENKPEEINLGKARFERFERNDGGYIRANSGGYQILLNFRGSQENFPTISLKQVLDNQITDDIVLDRLVLIGTTAPSINDSFYTPYGSDLFRSPQRTPGIIIHANIISQIISAAVEGRPLLRVWADPIEWLWILAWAGLGGAISWFFKSPLAISLTVLLANTGLLGGCYLAFLLGWWLPVIPPMVALWGAMIVLLLITNKQLNQLLFRHTLTSLLEVCQDHPTAGRIAIAYLKQSENKENQAFVDKKLGN